MSSNLPPTQKPQPPPHPLAQKVKEIVNQLSPVEETLLFGLLMARAGQAAAVDRKKIRTARARVSPLDMDGQCGFSILDALASVGVRSGVCYVRAVELYIGKTPEVKP